MNNTKYLYETMISAIVAYALMAVLAGSVLANDHAPYGTTWQIKCEQRGTGKEAQCWMVEIPNKPVPGIDVPFEVKK
jgi:hypothetical protein